MTALQNRFGLSKDQTETVFVRYPVLPGKMIPAGLKILTYISSEFYRNTIDNCFAAGYHKQRKT